MFRSLNTVIFLTLCLFSAAQANVVGTSAQNFNPTTSGLDFVTVHSSEILEPGLVNVGWFFNYSVNTLPNYTITTTQTRTEPADQLASMDLNFGLGLLKNWDIGFSIPQVIWQDVDPNSTNFRGQFETTGLTEVRANTKYRFFGDASGGLATILSMNWFLIENYPFTGINPGPTFNFELAYDWTWGLFNMAINGGYRLRNPGEPVPGVPVEPFPNEFIFSFATSYLVESWDTKLIAEIFSSVPTEEVRFTSDREISSAELLLGAKWAVTHDLALHLGGGTELYHGSASPDWRAYTGLNWTFGPLFHSSEPTTPISQEAHVEYLDNVDFGQTPQRQETFIAKDVLFEFNSADINPEFLETLKKLAQYLMKGNGFSSLEIAGHTDSVGSDLYNAKLSQNRANSVRQALKQFLPSEQHHKVSAVGYGESRPIADNGNFQGRALNRRVEFNIRRDL